MKLWLVRHAQPLIEAGICYGATDVEADAQATLKAAHALAQVLPAGLGMLSSPLQRCERLSQSICRLRPDLSYKTEPRLVEMDFGTWEGQRWDDIAPADLQNWTDAFDTWRCGGAESVDQMMARVSALWDASRASRQNAVWITHAGVIRAATLVAQGMRQVKRADQWPVAGPAFGTHQVLDDTAAP
jgi:alpha-ribazole phosphatase